MTSSQLSRAQWNERLGLNIGSRWTFDRLAGHPDSTGVDRSSLHGFDELRSALDQICYRVTMIAVLSDVQPNETIYDGSRQSRLLIHWKVHLTGDESNGAARTCVVIDLSKEVHICASARQGSCRRSNPYEHASGFRCTPTVSMRHYGISRGAIYVKSVAIDEPSFRIASLVNLLNTNGYDVYVGPRSGSGCFHFTMEIMGGLCQLGNAYDLHMIQQLRVEVEAGINMPHSVESFWVPRSEGIFPHRQVGLDGRRRQNRSDIYSNDQANWPIDPSNDNALSEVSAEEDR